MIAGQRGRVSSTQYWKLTELWFCSKC